MTMRKRQLALGLAAIAGLVLAVGLAAGGVEAGDEETIAVVERATSDAVIDLGAEGDSAGDVLSFANELYDAANEKKVGTDSGFCIRTAAGVSWECWWTATLAEGQITVEGPFLDAGDSVLAITGGTGEYASARGEMMLHARNAEGSEYDFVYKLED
jgi:allene oxide cyclase